MCGRTRCTLDPGLVARATGVPPEKWVDKEKFHPSYNLSPGRYTPILRNAWKPTDASEPNEASGPPKAGAVDSPERFIQCMKWGLVPSFTKKEEKPDFFRMFNARGESIHERAAFRRLLPRSRCVALAEGFYEWKKDEKSKAKQPYYIHYREEDRPLFFAALCDRWEDAEGNVLHTYTIVTTRVSKALEWLHDRMPVILGSQSEVDRWLQPELSVEEVLKLAKPYESPDLVWHPVTSEVGKPSFDSPACVKEVTPTSAKTSAIASLFKKASKPEPHAQKSDAQPALDSLEEEKAFAAAVIPDRDVSKALGKRKDHPEEEASENSVKASEKDGGASEAVKSAPEKSGRALESASEKVRGAATTVSETVGAAFDTLKGQAEKAVSETVGFASEKVKGAVEEVEEAVGAKGSGEGAGRADTMGSIPASERETVGKPEKAAAVGGLSARGSKKELPEEKVKGARKSGAHAPSPKSDTKQKGTVRMGGKSSEPSPKKQKTLTAFFTKA